MNGADKMELVRNARLFATLKHNKQQRKYTGEPYTDHLHNVVDLLLAHGVSEEPVLAAAWLHDTVEDTDVTLQDLIQSFPPEVVEYVYWLTDTDAGNRNTRAQIAAWRIGRSPWGAKLIKLADIIDNSRNVSKRDPDFAAVYLAEKRLVLNHMVVGDAGDIGSHPLFHMASTLTRARANVVQLR